LTFNQRITYERIDDLRLQGMQLAETKCRHLRMGQVAYTPQYSLLAKIVACWNLIVRFKSGVSVDSRFFSRILAQQKLSMVYIQSLSSTDAKSRRFAAYSELRAYAKSAIQSRTAWLESLTQARAECGHLSAEQEYQALLGRERQRRDARIIKAVTKGSTNAGLAFLHKLDVHGSVIEVHDRETMEQMLFTELSSRFNQASDTPFASPPLANLVGPFGTSDAALQILHSF
jgi:hypothetical protein